MKTGYRAHAVVRLYNKNHIEVVEVLPELSAATRLAKSRLRKDRGSKYIVCKTTVRNSRSKYMLQENARRIILKRWNKRAPKQRLEQKMFAFFSEISCAMPELLKFKTHGEPWQVIHCWLLKEERKRIKAKALAKRV